MSELLKSTQAIFKLNSKWNKVIELIKEINIEMYHQKDYREIVNEIVKEVFADERNS